MARNEEKAQSMLYRFREAKAMEMGLLTRQDRRPRMASSCKDLRACEKWRGEIMREISRKVTKIQDVGLTDYEVRDLNDEINKLMREKGHWENQIAALGGANYKRATGRIKGPDGKDVPSVRGYKYFGRARELPGVKELFSRRDRDNSNRDDPEARAQRRQRWISYRNMGPEYYGDVDESVEEMLAQAEREAEEEEWQDAIADVAETLGADPDSLTLPALPRPDYVTLMPPVASTSSAPIQAGGSNGVPPPPPPPPGDDDEDDDDDDAVVESAQADPKQESDSVAKAGEKRKAAEDDVDASGDTTMTPAVDGPQKAARREGGQTTAANVNRIFTVLREEDYRQPKLASLEELEKFLVEKQKQELLKEYV